MKYENLFTTPIFHDFLNLNLEELKEYSYRIKGQSEGRQVSNKLGWQSIDIQEDEEVQDLVKEIELRLEEIKSFSNIRDNAVLQISNMWVNINKKYSYNSTHIHSGSFFSGVFYIEVPENSGRINFENPSSLQKVFINSIKQNIVRNNEFTAHTWIYDPKPNMMVLFPSWIEHNVDQNLSDSDRISIAFNTRLLY